MKHLVFYLTYFIFPLRLYAQDTTVIIDNKKYQLPEVFVRNNGNYKSILQQIKEDTSFYKAFKNLRLVNYSAFNDVKLYNKNQTIKASLASKTEQVRKLNCRSMLIKEELLVGDYYKEQHQPNYITGQLFESLFFTNGVICNENNSVATTQLSLAGKSGIDKYKEQLKMLFFNPGRKISGIPFIGNKLDVYSDAAEKLYDYILEIGEFHGVSCYVFYILAKHRLEKKDDDIVIDELITRLDINTLNVLGRSYSLSYKTGIYDFDVSMEVEMQQVGDFILPSVLRYKGNWGILFSKRERGSFTTTFYNVHKE